MVLLLVLIQDFEGFDCFEKIGWSCQGFFRCLVDYLAKLVNADKWDYRTNQMLMKGPGLPESEADPVVMIFFGLIGGVEGETIGAGMLQGFAAVHSLIEDEECERASLLIGAVSGDFLHIEKLFGG